MRFQAQSASESDAARPHSASSNGRLFASATSLARKGRYTDATKILRSALEAGDCSEAEALDLQARIYAQQGLYLQAEACWRQAKSHDASNADYEDALARLRRARLATGRGLHILSGLVVALLLGLMVWQVFFVIPEMLQQIEHQKIAISSIQSSIDNEADAAAARDAELATSIDAYDRNAAQRDSQLAASIGAFRESVDKRDAQLAEAISLLGTDEDAAANRDVVLQRLTEATAAIEKANQTLFKGIASDRAEADEAARKQIAALSASLATLAKSLESTETALAERVARSESAASKQLNEAIGGVTKRIDGLLSSESLAAIEDQIRQLNERLATVTSAMKRLQRQQSDDPDTADKPSPNLESGQANEAIEPKETQP